MKNKGKDLNIPAKPYFWGTWADGTLTTLNTYVTIPITTVNYKQKGMRISGNGVSVPIPGLYYIGCMIRTDCAVAPNAAVFDEMILQVNGGPANGFARTVQNNGYINGNLYPYDYHQLWIPRQLNSGDIVTMQLYSNVNINYFGTGSWPGSGLRLLYSSPMETL